ncbi:TPA: hypothetical protein L4975_006280 [Pseudomonas aeruginosa]|nr:hypothetical protein [Pseudomonas aeruginosa]
MPLHDVSLVEGGLSAPSVPLCLKPRFCQAEIYDLRRHVSKNAKDDSILTKRCRFQKTAALNVRSRLHYSSGGVGSIRQRRAAAGHQRTQGGLSATGRSMRHRWPSRRGSESARIDLRCPTSH